MIFGMAVSTEDALRREVRRLIAECGSQRRLSTRLRISQASISDFLHGGGVGSKMLEAVLRETGKSVSDLLGVSSSQPQATSSPLPLPIQRNLTPTPAPSSTLRASGIRMDLPDPPRNRERAIEILVSRGFERSRVDEEMAVAAMDAGLSPFEDRPVGWWIEVARSRISSHG